MNLVTKSILKMNNIFLCLSFFFVLQSCSKERNVVSCYSDPFETITQGSWRYTELFVKDIIVLGNGDTLSGSLLDDKKSCEYLSKWVFNSDFSMSLEHDSLGCFNFENYGEWSLDGLVFTTHEKDENEYIIHTIECINKDEILGNIEVDDTNLPIPRLAGSAEFTLTKN